MVRAEEKKTKNTWVNILLVGVAIVGIVGGYFAYVYYTGFFKGNVTDREDYLYVRTGWTFDDVMNSVEENGILKDPSTFRWAAEKMDYPNRVKPGRYKLELGMTNRTLINKLGGGLQEPVRLRFENIRLREDFAALIADQLEADSLSIITLLQDEELASKHGFNAETFFTVFIPNTYEFYWNTSAEQFLKRMLQEYERFWTEERREKSRNLDMSPQEVSILASIVQGEAMHKSEMPTIAGLYLNRLERGIRLQADPTVIYAAQDFSIRRVLHRHLNIDSPYNTYRYTGLPPGPIMMPSIAAIDAVLNHEEHNYIYMCAKEDFSGYHRFAETFSEHSKNARLFQQALNERNIRQ